MQTSGVVGMGRMSEYTQDALTDYALLEYARLYRNVERRVRSGQIGLDYPIEQRSAEPRSFKGARQYPSPLDQARATTDRIGV